MGITKHFNIYHQEETIGKVKYANKKFLLDEKSKEYFAEDKSFLLYSLLFLVEEKTATSCSWCWREKLYSTERDLAKSNKESHHYCLCNLTDKSVSKRIKRFKGEIC